MTHLELRERIARRGALEVFPGARVNLGIGLPTLIPAYLSSCDGVWIHSENGFLGMGEACDAGGEDPDLIDAGGRYVKLVPGASFFDSALSFAIVRGGRLDLCFLGAFQVDLSGNLANWRIPGRLVPGVGGAIELAQKVPRVIVTTLHAERSGAPKLVEACTLPLTARACVALVITELAVLEPTGKSFRVLELAPGVDLGEVEERTGAPLEAGEVRPWRVAPPGEAA